MRHRIATVVLTTSLLPLSLWAGIAQTRPTDIQWSGQASGQPFQVPSGEKPTVMFFVREGQPLSAQVLQQAPKLLESGLAQAVVVFSGPLAQQQAAQGARDLSLPTVADTDYALSGKMGVHAWPTTVMVNPKGDVMAHIAGVTKSYDTEFSASLEFLAGKITQAEMDAKLKDRTIVTDNPAQAASRHLQMASRLISRDRLDQALAEIETGLKLQPDSAQLQLAQVRVLVLQGKLEEAAKVLDGIKPGSAPAPQIDLARGRLLVAKGELQPAIELLEQAVKLNPNPSDAQYELGLAYQKLGQFDKAASAFRAAYEARE